MVLFCFPDFCVRERHFEVDIRQISNIRGTLEGNKIVGHSDVVGASPVGAVSFIRDFTVIAITARRGRQK